MAQDQDGTTWFTFSELQVSSWLFISSFKRGVNTEKSSPVAEVKFTANIPELLLEEESESESDSLEESEEEDSEEEEEESEEEESEESTS